MGTVVIGKVESGKCSKGDTLIVMPNRVSYRVVYQGGGSDLFLYVKDFFPTTVALINR